MKKLTNKTLYVIILLLVISWPVNAQISLDTLLITEGLNKEGSPVTFKKEFNLKEDKGVQYYVEWIKDNKEHNVAIKWFGPNEQLIKFLNLNNFSNNIVRDYISFSNDKRRNQIIIPKWEGRYLIYLYVDKKLIAVSRFKLVE